MAFERNTSDLHLHLNGSFSMAFLEKMALENGSEAGKSLARLKELREQYAKLRAESKSIPEIEKRCEKLIWDQFPLISKIVTEAENLVEGTVDVVSSSKASYLEIRTSPKGADPVSRQLYIDAFVRGLRQANAKQGGKKIAYGLLSLDRSSCIPEVAHEIIDAVAAEKARSGLLVGIDLSGNYLAPRKLTGKALAGALVYALSKNIGLALHVGEIDSPEERSDVDLILETLASWQRQQKPSARNLFHGKVRLGHGIFLTPRQIQQIQEMQLPIEICPACHEKLNWWQAGQPHPVTKIYSSWKDPVVTGTDDELFFGEDARTANRRVLDFLAYPGDRKKGDARAHQVRFRFASANKTPPASTSYLRYGVGIAVAALGVAVIAARLFSKGKAADSSGAVPARAPSPQSTTLKKTS